MTSFLRELNQKTLIAGQLDRWFRSLADYEGVIDFRITPKKEKDDAFHPSSDAYECNRVMYAKILGDYKSPRRDGLQKSFMVGNMYHGVIQYALVDMAMARPEDIEKEHQIRKENWWARGFIDVAHCDTTDGDYLVDIKTMNSNSFRLPNFTFDLWNKYERQVNLYLEWEGLEKAVLFCVQKDSPHAFKEYVIKRNPVLIDSIYTKWDIVSEAVKLQEPPECDCGDLGKNPSSCAVLDLYTTA